MSQVDDEIATARKGMQAVMRHELARPCKRCGKRVELPEDIPEPILALIYLTARIAPDYAISAVCDDCGEKEDAELES